MEVTEPARERIIDDEHLRLLAIGHYITGGLYIAFASLFIFHFAFFAFFAANPEFFSTPDGKHGPPDGFLGIFLVMFGLFILAGWAIGGLTVYVGRCIGRRKHRGLTFVMACLNVLFIPFGTILGVFTLIVLSRRSVKEQYAP